jgi:isopentenyl-diphosphate delta-isomerase
MEKVVLVDENDNTIGEMEKLEAHLVGALHRAFSVFGFNTKGEMLLQQRASTKYHSPNLWTNTCCSHPRINETPHQAAVRRTIEEMGLRVEPKFQFKFTYKAEFDNKLIEHELDHVFFATISDEPILNPNEAQAYRWISLDNLEQELSKNPEQFTPWFKICFNQVRESLLNYQL